MDRETLETLDLKPGEIRENITVSGLDFTTLEAGHRVSLGGAAVVEVTGPCAPCSRMDEIRPGLKDELQGRRGKLAFVVETGEIGIGDPSASFSVVFSANRGLAGPASRWREMAIRIGR